MRCIDICGGEAVSQVKYLDFGSARRVARDAGMDVTLGRSQPDAIVKPCAGFKSGSWVAKFCSSWKKRAAASRPNRIQLQERTGKSVVSGQPQLQTQCLPNPPRTYGCSPATPTLSRSVCSVKAVGQLPESGADAVSEQVVARRSRLIKDLLDVIGDAGITETRPIPIPNVC